MKLPSDLGSASSLKSLFLFHFSFIPSYFFISGRLLFPLSFFPIFILVCSRLLFSVFLHMSSTAPSSLPFTPRLYETKTRLQNSSPVSPNLIFVGPSLSLSLSISRPLSLSSLIPNCIEYLLFRILIFPSLNYFYFLFVLDEFLPFDTSPPPLSPPRFVYRHKKNKRTNQTYLKIYFIKS